MAKAVRQQAAKQQKTTAQDAAPRRSCSATSEPKSWASLQRGVGNRATAQLAAGLAARQREQEADRAADTIVHSGRSVDIQTVPLPGRAIDRKCSKCEDEEKSMLVDRKACSLASLAEGTAVETPSGGEPLSESDRVYFESRFGRDLSSVRVHHDASAARSATQLGSRAFASGPHLVFGAGEYAPGTRGGRWLLAHELAHVVQQVPLPRLTEGAGVQANLDRAGPGRPLESRVRSRMEKAFGAMFSRVRIHTDAAAAGECSRAGKPALTMGDHVLIRPELYRPGTPAGDALLAHQLAHTMERAAPPRKAESRARQTATKAMFVLWGGGRRKGMASLLPRLYESMQVRPALCDGGGSSSGTRQTPTTTADPCDDICRRARADSSMNGGGGGVVCDGATKCPCAFDLPSFNLRVGECPEFDRIVIVHERRHLTDVDCDATKGLHRPPFRDPSTATGSECTHRRESIGLLDTAIAGGSGDCVTKMRAVRTALDGWVTANCS